MNMEAFVASTNHFEIYYDDTLGVGVLRLAQALAQTCEFDYQRCVGWFGVQVPFRSPDTPGFIRVLILTRDGGWNNGSGGFIQLDPGADPTSLRFIFISELTEMFMLAQGSAWIPSDSKGEALSRLLSEEAYPTAPAEGLYFTAQSWLGTGEDPTGSGHRRNWVDQSEPTDQNFKSIGCAILFLNYVRWQLGYSLQSILMSDGKTLEALYEQVVGGNGGFQPFSDLLNRFFPIGSHPSVGDNPFPLLDAAYRTLQLSFSASPLGAPVVLRSGAVEEQFLGCPPKPYSYSVKETSNNVICTAKAIGFGVPVFQWTINGVVAPLNGIVQFSVTVFDQNPQSVSGGAPVIVPVVIECTIGHHGATLTLTPISAMVGHVALNIQVTTSDSFVEPSEVFVALGAVSVASQQVVFDPTYYKDAYACAKAFINRHHFVAPPFDHLSQAIGVLLTLPDPSPEFSRALAILEQMAEAVISLRTSNSREATEQFNHMLTTRLAGSPTIAALLTGAGVRS
jgi:hypothetical protein